MFKMKAKQIFSRRERRSAFPTPDTVSGMKPFLQLRTANLLLLLLCGLVLAPARLPGQERFLVYLTGPSLSRHFHPYHDRFNDLHLGLGVEAYLKKNRLLLGVNGHYMFNDSMDRPSCWVGVAPGYFFGVQNKWWASLAAVAGGLEKARVQPRTLFPFRPALYRRRLQADRAEHRIHPPHRRGHQSHPARAAEGAGLSVSRVIG